MPPEYPSSESPTILNCPSCGTAMARELTGGLCPRCLLATAMSDDDVDSLDYEDTPETIDSDTTGTRTGGAIEFDPKSGTKTIGDYELINEIARGGMGVVYRARHQKLGREVALKVILSGQFASSHDVRRFQLEAESAANLDHPGIVPIYEIGEHEGHHYFTMKLIEGGSLAQQLPTLRNDLRAFVSVVAESAEAIDYAHRRGILHRDIKPANILLGENGRPLITDLGLAKRDGIDSNLTGTGAIVGTPAYMPPEQAAASKEITTSADVYAIGAILYEGLTGRPPHQGDSAIATLMQAAKGSITPPSDVNRKVDRVLELICMKCLSHDPDERYASAGLMADDLRRWLAGESVSVRPKSFAAVFSDLAANHLRSALGAMLIGALGGLISGAPVYTGIATRWFGGTDARFDLAKLQAALPNVTLGDAWWLHPPRWMVSPGFFIGVLVSILLGLIIQMTVRPKDVRQAIAFGLVAGLLMTIVQFGMYGIAAGWQTFALVNADTVDQLARASLLQDGERQIAVDEIYTKFPDLKQMEPGRRAKLLGKVVSVQIMLGTPAIFVACLIVCLAFSIIYCLAGSVHANRLVHGGYGRFAVLSRYTEVMVLLTAVVLTTSMIVFFAFGMVTDNNEKLSLPPQLLAVWTLLSLATIPGFCLMRWYYRWPVYAVCVGLVVVIIS